MKRERLVRGVKCVQTGYMLPSWLVRLVRLEAADLGVSPGSVVARHLMKHFKQPSQSETTTAKGA